MGSLIAMTSRIDFYGGNTFPKMTIFRRSNGDCLVFQLMENFAEID